MCLAKCLKFPEFEAGCAYKRIAYKKKRVHRVLGASYDGYPALFSSLSVNQHKSYAVMLLAGTSFF